MTQIAQDLLHGLLIQEKVQLAEGSVGADSLGMSTAEGTAAMALQRFREDLLQVLTHHLKLCSNKQKKRKKHKASEGNKHRKSSKK